MAAIHSQVAQEGRMLLRDLRTKGVSPRVYNGHVGRGSQPLSWLPEVPPPHSLL